jgi:hypothetical protein
MSEVFAIWISVMFGVPLLIVLIDFLADAFRGLASSRRHAFEPTYEDGFNLRRPDSELRGRHRHKVRPVGRTAEINRYKDDPYDL